MSISEREMKDLIVVSKSLNHTELREQLSMHLYEFTNQLEQELELEKPLHEDISSKDTFDEGVGLIIKAIEAWSYSPKIKKKKSQEEIIHEAEPVDVKEELTWGG